MRAGLVPLEVSARMQCKWRDGEFHPVRVIDRRKRSVAGGAGPLKGDATDFEYYVHYEQCAWREEAARRAAAFDFAARNRLTRLSPCARAGAVNRRMDDWVLASACDLRSVEYDAAAAERDAGKGHARGGRKRDDPAPSQHGGNAHPADDEHAEFDQAALRQHEEHTKVRNILRVELGRHEMDTWYFSPFPAEYNDVSKLYFCEFTLAFFKRKEQMRRHLRKNELLHPPGDEIYRHNGVSMFEVDGRKEKMYCQNLCYLAKLFLDHKTLYYDVDLFLFYILCETDERGCHIVGYFSKEKHSEEGYNLACILTLPPYQRKGYGKFLISFSYELSKKEKKVGTPERPLSDLGLVSYRGYWTRVLLTLLTSHPGPVSIKDLSEATGIKTDDIIATLGSHLNMLAYQKGAYALVVDPATVAKHLKAAGSAGVEVEPSKLLWTPYVSRTDVRAPRRAARPLWLPPPR